MIVKSAYNEIQVIHGLLQKWEPAYIWTTETTGDKVVIVYYIIVINLKIQAP